MPHVPGLRSPYLKVGRLVYFGRMLDKIRLHAAGRLPADYVPNLGDPTPFMFDGRCCRFLGVPYEAARARTLEGGTDEEVLAELEARGTRRSDEECEVWNAFMMKLGWRDSRSAALQERIGGYGLAGRPIPTIFDLFDFDEGRNPAVSRPWDVSPRPVVVVMGVAGSGKTTVGLKLAETLGWPFKDADDLHSAANVAKMAAGIPLDDEDRAPWLSAVRAHIDACLAAGTGGVFTCSALKEKYRQVVVADPERVRLVHLTGDFEVILRRIAARKGHFMKEDLLRSQFESLEPPKDALDLDVALPPETLVARIRDAFHL